MQVRPIHSTTETKGEELSSAGVDDVFFFRAERPTALFPTVPTQLQVSFGSGMNKEDIS